MLDKNKRDSRENCDGPEVIRRNWIKIILKEGKVDFKITKIQRKKKNRTTFIGWDKDIILSKIDKKISSLKKSVKSKNTV